MTYIKHYMKLTKLHTTGTRIIYTIILLKSVAVRNSCSGRLGRCLKLFVSTDSPSCHAFVSQIGLAIFLYAKSTQTLAETVSPRKCLFQWTSDRPRKGAVTASRLVASNTSNSVKLNGDNCGHSGDRLSQNGERATSQNGNNKSLYIHGLNNLAYELLHSPCICSV